MSSPPERFYRFGSVVLRLLAPAFPEAEQLGRFACAAQPADLTVRVRPVGELSLPPGEPRREPGVDWYRTDGCDVSVMKDPAGEPLWVARYADNGCVEACFRPDRLTLTTFVISEIIDLPRLLLQKEAVLLHASYIAAGGRAVLFTAKKQTGKSTQAALWARCEGAAVVNGDRAMIEQRNGVYYACGVPYAGTSKICLAEDHPLRAVVILSQGARNEARRATPGEAIRALLEGCTVDPANEPLMNRFITLAENIAGSVPFFRLSCLPDESAVACLKAAFAASETCT